MGGSSSSSSDVEQFDRRIGATDEAKVVTEGGRLVENTDTRTRVSIERAEAPVIKAALGAEGITGLIDRALSFSEARSDQERKTVEKVLTSQAQLARDALQEGEESADTFKTALLASAALVALVAFSR